MPEGLVIKISNGLCIMAFTVLIIIVAMLAWDTVDVVPLERLFVFAVVAMIIAAFMPLFEAWGRK